MLLKDLHEQSLKSEAFFQALPLVILVLWMIKLQVPILKNHIKIGLALYWSNP